MQKEAILCMAIFTMQYVWGYAAEATRPEGRCALEKHAQLGDDVIPCSAARTCFGRMRPWKCPVAKFHSRGSLMFWTSPEHQAPC